MNYRRHQYVSRYNPTTYNYARSSFLSRTRYDPVTHTISGRPLYRDSAAFKSDILDRPAYSSHQFTDARSPYREEVRVDYERTPRWNHLRASSRDDPRVIAKEIGPPVIRERYIGFQEDPASCERSCSHSPSDITREKYRPRYQSEVKLDYLLINRIEEELLGKKDMNLHQGSSQLNEIFANYIPEKDVGLNVLQKSLIMTARIEEVEEF